jgi:spore germination cell wall hydrolase CwlJ-like protein
MVDWDHLTAARTAWQEARGETPVGQQAVAHVIVNRLKDGRWGKTLSEVCLWNRHVQGGGQVFQFSGWREEDPNFAAACRLPDSDPLLLSMSGLITLAQTGPDMTGGALFYYAPPAAPGWASAPGMRQCGTYGHQVFLSDRPRPQAMV